MATMPTPKSPMGLLLLAGAAIWLMTKSKAATAKKTGVQDTRLVIGRPAVTQYTSPTTAAELLASRVLAMTRGLTSNATAVQAEEAAREAGRNAVRANDATYGSGAFAWFANNVEEARRTMGEGGWSAPTITTVTMQDSGSLGGQVDTIPAAAIYDPSQDSDRFNLAGLLSAYY